ncbi:TPA: hypothetical protein HA259_01980 [Thermoplasmata archaeon]|nr:hypothetical protein [Thermoplasmata archaeon]
MIFKHETDPFSPTFEVSCPRMYVYNDTDGDSLFDLDEASLTVFLDSNHVTWNVSAFEKDFDEGRGEFALVEMVSSIHAYVVGENETMAVQDWAELSFSFFLAEMPVEYDCSGGTYVIDGKTEMRMSFTLRPNVYLDSDGVVLEQFLQGGGSTNMFHLIEGSEDGGNVTTKISALVDERESGEDYCHELNETTDVMQKIHFAKEDEVVNAFYFWESRAELVNNGTDSVGCVNSSYFTTGAGMLLHSVLPVSNCTTELTHDSTMGIFESGFVGGVSDWIREYIVPFVVLCCAIALISLTLVYRRRRARSLKGETKSDEAEDR